MSCGLTVTQGWRGHVVMSHGWRGQIEVMSHGHRVTQGHHTGATATSHGGTWMEGTRSDVTWTQHNTRMEGTHHSDVMWTQRDTRPCHSMTRGRRGHVVMSCGLSMTRGCVTLWHMDGGDTTVMSCGLTVTRGHHTGATATSHGGTRMEGTD